MKNPVSLLRKIGHLEAISFLVLMGVAMPMKYMLGMPLAVKVAGWIHGVLFIALCISLAQTTFVAKWPIGRAILVFIAALLPFGPFLLDRKMRGYEEAFNARNTGKSPEALEKAIGR